MRKKFEFAFKRVTQGKTASCIPPDRYAFRFYDFLSNSIEGVAQVPAQFEKIQITKTDDENHRLNQLKMKDSRKSQDSPGQYLQP